MSRSHLIRASAIAAAVFASSAFAASDNATMTVTASVAAICKVKVTAMDFGGLDVTVGTDAIKNATATYQCTNGTVAGSFGVGTALNNSGTFDGAMTSTTTSDTIPYTVTWTDPGSYTGVGMANDPLKQKTVTLKGTIANDDYVNVTPASYKQDVNIYVNF